MKRTLLAFAMGTLILTLAAVLYSIIPFGLETPSQYPTETVQTAYGDSFYIENRSFLAAESYNVYDSQTDNLVGVFGKNPSIEPVYCSDGIRCYDICGDLYYKIEGGEWRHDEPYYQNGQWCFDGDARIIPVIKNELTQCRVFADHIPYLMQEYPDEMLPVIKANFLSDRYIYERATDYFFYHGSKELKEEIKQVSAMLARGDDEELLYQYGFDKADDEDKEYIRRQAESYFRYGSVFAADRELLETTEN